MTATESLFAWLICIEALASGLIQLRAIVAYHRKGYRAAFWLRVAIGLSTLICLAYGIGIAVYLVGLISPEAMAPVFAPIPFILFPVMAIISVHAMYVVGLQAAVIESTTAAERAMAELAQGRELVARMAMQIVQNASHELRTPLALALGYAALLLEGAMGELQQAQRQAIEVIHARTRGMSVIVDMMMILVQKTHKSHFWLRDVVEQVALAMTPRAAARGITITQSYPAEGRQFYGDYQKIRVAVQALISNAIKFNKEGGHIDIQLAYMADIMCLVIADTGIGISEENLGMIFEIMFQADGDANRLYEGLGLGLAVVSHVVKDHSGWVEVQSEKDKGSTFSIFLPLLEVAGG